MIGRAASLTLISVAVLAACGEQQAASPPGSNAAGAGAKVEAANAAAPPSNPALWAGGAQRPLDVQATHPNGVVLQLTSLQSRPTETAIGVRVLNGREREISLNQWNNRQGFLMLDNGDRLYVSPPANNPTINIPAGQTFEGELVFLGRLPPSQSATLILNENNSTGNQYETSPGFRITLPLADAAS